MIWLIIAVGLLIANSDAEINDSEKLRANLDGSCEPNTYIFVDCNVCHCDLNGRIDTNHCTRRPCDSDKNQPYKANSNEYQPYKANSDKYQSPKAQSDKYQSYKGNSNEYKPYKARRMAVHGSCESGTWYSLAPCQFCYCVDNNKLVCSTGNSQKSQLLELGMYNLTVCGKHLIKDVLELIPEGQDALRQGFQNAQTQNNQQTNADKSGAQAHVDPKRDAPNTNYAAMAPVHLPQSQYQLNREVSEEINKTSNDVSEYDSDSSDIESLENFLKKTASKSEKVVSNTQQTYDEDEETDREIEEEKVKKTHKHESKSKHHHSTAGKTIREPTRPEKSHKKYDSKDEKYSNKPYEVDQTSKSVTDSSLLGASGMLRLKLPQVLDKLLQMSLRKSYNKDDDDAIEDLSY